MIFGTGLFLFVVAYVVSAANAPNPPGLAIATAGLFGAALMLASFCMAISRWMP